MFLCVTQFDVAVFLRFAYSHKILLLLKVNPLNKDQTKKDRLSLDEAPQIQNNLSLFELECFLPPHSCRLSLINHRENLHL